MTPAALAGGWHRAAGREGADAEVWPWLGPKDCCGQEEMGTDPPELHPRHFKGHLQSLAPSCAIIVQFCFTVNRVVKKSGFFSMLPCQNARRRLFLTFPATVK